MFQLYESMSSPHTPPDLAQLLKQLPIDAPEPTVCANFIRYFLEYLGFNPLTDIIPEFSTGEGNKQVDYALRKSDLTSPFISLSHKNGLPEIILEAKGRATEAGFLNLSYGTAKYKSTVRQLMGYFKDPHCRKSVKWGIITNGNHIQVFRKHGKAIHPVMPCVEINR